MNWKFTRFDWHNHGNCWTWWKITKSVFYSGNQVEWIWGRIVLVFERNRWI
jgi:hypothetical protein